jgi:hypothetical protein
MKSLIIAAAALACAARLSAQDATIVYRLGHDTVAVEQFTRFAGKFAGETVVRSGPTVTRTQYDITLVGGKPTAMVIRRRQADGSPIPNNPLEYRFAFRPDSVRRDVVWKDSTQTQSFAAANAFVVLPVYSYAPFELIYARAAGRDSIPAVNLGGSAISAIGLQKVGGDTLRMRGGTYQMLIRFDRDGRLQWTDGVLTTNKAIGTRITGSVDIAKLASSMRPTGVLSPRASAYAGFNRGPIFISYGKPAVRERSVWGGVLIPFDSIWRTGANEATHLATSKTMVLGDMTLAPGLYTLWTQHTRAGTYLIVNKQVGQWGTEYTPAQDIGRVKMEMAKTPEHVEDFTITIRAAGANRGFIDLAWGDSVATAAFPIRLTPRAGRSGDAAGRRYLGEQIVETLVAPRHALLHSRLQHPVARFGRWAEDRHDERRDAVELRQLHGVDRFAREIVELLRRDETSGCRDLAVFTPHAERGVLLVVLPHEAVSAADAEIHLTRREIPAVGSEQPPLEELRLGVGVPHEPSRGVEAARHHDVPVALCGNSKCSTL